MNLISIPVAMMAAVCLYVGVYYVLFFMRRREMENLLFACTCFSIALYDVFCVGLYNAASFAEGMFWQRLQFAGLALFSVAVSWFTYFFTGTRFRRIFTAISIWFSGLFIAGITLRGEWTLSLTSPKPKHVDLGGVFSFTYHEVDPGLIYGVQYVSMILLALFILYVMILHYRGGDRAHSRPILLALIVFFAASLNDAFVGMAVYPFIYLLEYTYLFIILSMAYVLLNRFVDLHHEVEELNVALEKKVNERSMELLFRDIGARLYVDMLRDLSLEKKGAGNAAPLGRLFGFESASSVESLSRDLGIISNTEELLARITARAAEISTARRGCLLLLNDESSLEAMAFYNMERTPDIEAHARRAFQEKTILSALRGVPSGDEAGLVHILCVPVMSGEIAIGVCCVEKDVPAGPFPDDDAQLLFAFMRQAAPAIGNALVYRKARGTGAARRRSSLTPHIEEKLKKAIAYVTENYTSEISRENLAASLNMHPDTLSRYFRLYTGRKIAEYINELRVREVARRIREEPDATIIDIAFSAGFESMATFSRAFIKVMRCTPTDFRAGLK